MRPDELQAIHETMHRLEQRWNLLPIPDLDGFHPYDPLPPAEFLPLLREASALTAGRRLLDLGCGIGRNLSIAFSLGWQVAGVDRHRPYVEAARELLPEAEIVEADIRALDRFDADVVYMYRPAVADEAEDALEAHVTAGLEAGTVLLLPTRPRPVRVI